MNYWILSFLSGATGAMLGGTASFVVTGLVGVLVVLIQVCGSDATLLNNEVLGLFFMPCICFSGAAAGMAFASNIRKHPLNGADGNRSLFFTGDPFVLIVSGIFGMLGYGLYRVFTTLNVPTDCGALVVLSLNMLARVLFGTKKFVNKPKQPLFRRATLQFWIFQIMFSGIIAMSTAYFINIIQVPSLGFSISALSLIFAFSHPEFPATHHITLIAGLSIVLTQSYLLSIILGIVAQIIFIVFTNYFNTDLDSHVDGPAAAIAPLTCIIMMIA